MITIFYKSTRVLLIHHSLLHSQAVSVSYAGVALYPGKLKLQLVSGNNLPVADFGWFRQGSSDPFAVVSVWTALPTSSGVLETMVERSMTIYQNLNPIWNEMMQFKVGCFLWGHARTGL